MLQLSGAGKRFGHKLLFEDVNWLVTPNERTGSPCSVTSQARHNPGSYLSPAPIHRQSSSR